jgi:hypothetical protein
MVGTKLYFKLYKRPFSVAIHYTVVMNQSFPYNKNVDLLKFMLALAQGLMVEHGSGVPCPVHGCPSIEVQTNNSKNDISQSVFLSLESRQNLRENVWCAQNMGIRENLFIGALKVKQDCVYTDILQPTMTDLNF